MMRLFTPIVTIIIKELRELFSRPWQVLTLIVGPLVLMVCFGIGADTSANPPRTVVVVPSGQARPRLLNDYQRQFDQFLDVVEYTEDEAHARALLRQGVVDAVVVLPPNAFATISSGKQASIQVLYNQIDPLWRWVVPNFTQVMAGEINREIFVQTISQQQAGLEDASRDVDTVLRALELASDAADAGDRVSARQHVQEARAESSHLADSLDRLGPEADQLRASVQQVQDRLRTAEDNLSNVVSPTATPDDNQPLREQLGLDESLRRVRVLDETLQRFASVPPEVIISPLTVDARNLARLEPDIVTFYAPGILALLLQHMGVSMGALALVRERLTGSFDLYTVAPMSRLQLLLGKYLAYSLFTLVIGIVVVAVLLGGLHVPLLGSPWLLALTLVLLTAASVGLGLLFSLLASSERQAVQFAMLSLLSIVLFSGFTLPLTALLPAARAFAYALPATYGVILFQGVMLRGTNGGWALFLLLAAIAGVLFAMCLALLHWRTRAR